MSDTRIAEMPMDRDTCAPYTMRARMSRPNWSVPSQWLALGGWRRWAMFILITTLS